ncbi:MULTISPECIES: hypothetical protein [Loigolactobacillus]|uniref:hypothetical protein n=1 Tax=Loigolactobacillus TaxID=2767889 RepID=UPI000A599BB9|nr:MULTISPECIES: hypothetical protein [Loigolactobacillus]MDA5387695.1 hypothetical protein [Loigolactobacillus backii]MDA5390237.1 hypothetical protein [Loigolactobacillus backii]
MMKIIKLPSLWLLAAWLFLFCQSFYANYSWYISLVYGILVLVWIFIVIKDYRKLGK